MKILELRFKNLNSLHGEWLIDVRHPEYVSNGIFALTGPTGAGKSTILDAICLALYGSTPRLGKITKSGNEIMSRQTGECYAEVLFESQAGRFRCHWEQRRARKQADGNLQDQEHQIADADTGKPIETKRSRVVGVIEEKTGMDFDRFTRSILLAQGGFDTFLKADIEQKSKILEQITGTEIYSDISRRAHERQRDERERLQLLQAEISGIVILEPAQETALEQTLETARQQEMALAAKSSETGKAINWLTRIEALNKDILNLRDEAARLQAETEAFKPEWATLEQADRAASLEADYATLVGLRERQSGDQRARQTLAVTLPEVEASATTQAEVLERAGQHSLNSKQALEAAAPLIQKIRLLDQQIAERARAVSAAEAACARQRATIKTLSHERAGEQQRRSQAEAMGQKTAQYLSAHGQDERLISELGAIETQFAALLGRHGEIARRERECNQADRAMAEAAESLDRVTAQCSLHRQGVERAAKNLQQAKDVLNRLLGEKRLREYRAEKEALLREMLFLKRIEALEAQRARLEDGAPCPLCGAVAHPYAEGNIPLPDEVEQQIASLAGLIGKAEDQEGAITQGEQALTRAGEQLNASEKQATQAAHARQTAEMTRAELQNALGASRADAECLRLAVLAKLQPLGITAIAAAEIPSLRETLQCRLQTWQETVGQQSQIEQQIATIDSETKRLDAVIETQRNALTERQDSLRRLQEEHAEATDERRRLYGDKQPEQEAHRLNQAIGEADAEERQASGLNGELQQQLTRLKTEIDALTRRIEQTAPTLENAEAAFAARLLPAGFADEPQFLRARRSPEQRESLNSRARALDRAATGLRAKQTDREGRLATETARKVTDKTREELVLQCDAHEQSLKIVRDEIAGCKHRLTEHAAARERIRERQSAIDAQNKACHRWDKLHALIGSADGKKYRNFAQGMTFELMVSHANRQLRKMTDRYLLIRDARQPLELNVVDDYQGGEIRSIRNLSGGESFIVSLTLALGLSKMASRKVRVDSLFLDEGFGTLDEEALGTALDTLSGLQQDGKLIGIISHVAALKERISTQINITPVAGGRSRLVGPGCEQVDG
jgi:exonuclease SbcC